MSEVRVGQFVRTQHNRLGVGKVVGGADDRVDVEYFDSVAADGRVVHTMPAGHVERTPISLQRRCYWQEGGRWRVGRVVWQGEEEYGVRVPDSELDLRIPESELLVRWDEPIADPMEVLVAYGNESPHFHVCRQPFIASITEQRAASRGMHGLLSSVVEVHNHQVEVARRILEDPHQRYLLADEVGLGKTIEAGLVIRQYLLDHPDGHVVVIAPPLLRRQWVSELRQKFLIDDFDGAVISVLSHDNPGAWLGGASDAHGRSRSHREAGLVVVDEVHNIAALHDAGPERDGIYASLVELTAAVPRLLLLSATPLLNNERTFLAMLHLLDPDIYRLDDIDGFRQRVRDRRELGTAFFTFRHDAPGFLLKEKVDALRLMFPSDPQLGGLLDGVEAALADRSNGGDLVRSVTAVRIHISETYRLHRRLLRTRRTDALLDTFPVRGRQRPELIPVSGGSAASPLDWLDDWRDYSRATLADDADPDEREHAIRAFVALAERAASHPSLLVAAARYRLKPSDKAAAEAELSDDEKDSLRRRRVSSEERTILDRAQGLEDDGDSARAVAEAIRTVRRKTVIFCSFTAAARSLGDQLRSTFGDETVAMHVATAKPSEVEAELDRFREPDGLCRVLICDRSAEEGRNLQFADEAIHLDLPLSPNRLEQRIGRLDRYGRGNAIPSLVLEFPNKSIPAAWLGCVTEGFRIFDESIASLQFAVDEILPGVHAALFDNGISGLEAVLVGLPQRLADERLAVAEQDALDAVEAASQDVPLATALDDVEDLWFQHQVAAEDLLCDRHGNLRFYRVIDRSDERFRSYKLTRPGKGATLNSMPLVAWDLLLSRFRSVVDRSGTYSRRSAVGRENSRLYRVGEPLIDALAGYMRWDDRGQTFALWRLCPAAGDDAAYFRFDYLIEADTRLAVALMENHDDPFDRRALQRRADGFLSPWIATLWTDVDGMEVTNSTLLANLERPYEPKVRDFNLNADRRWALEQVVGDEDWPHRCRTAREVSETALRRSPQFTDPCDRAAASFVEASAQNQLQRELRLTHLNGTLQLAEDRELSRVRVTDAALLNGIRAPSVRLDSVGAIVLSSALPNGAGFPRGTS